MITFPRARSVSAISLSTRTWSSIAGISRRGRKPFPPCTVENASSVFDDLHALPAVSRLSGPHLNHQGHLKSPSRHDRDTDREAGDLFRHRRGEALDARDDRFQVVRVRDFQDDLRVALAEDVLVHLRRPLRDDDQAEPELAPLRRPRAEHLT